MKEKIKRIFTCKNGNSYESKEPITTEWGDDSVNTFEIFFLIIFLFLCTVMILMILSIIEVIIAKGIYIIFLLLCIAMILMIMGKILEDAK